MYRVLIVIAWAFFLLAWVAFLLFMTWMGGAINAMWGMNASWPTS